MALRSERQGEGGFTLIEMLVTLALLSLLGLTLFASMHYGTRIWEASHAAATADENVREAQEEIAEIVTAAYPEFTLQDASHANIAFDGEPASLRVLAPDRQLQGALSYFTIRTAPSRSGSALVLDRQLELAANGASQRSSSVLLDGVASLALSYFGPEKSGQEPQWSDHWQDRTRPPLLVRIRAVLMSPHTAWPEMTVAPRIVADIECTLDALTKTCQGR